MVHMCSELLWIAYRLHRKGARKILRSLALSFGVSHLPCAALRLEFVADQ